jgi:hypothetical protein
MTTSPITSSPSKGMVAVVAARWQQIFLSATPQTLVNKGIPRDWWQSGSKKTKKYFLHFPHLLLSLQCQNM